MAIRCHSDFPIGRLVDQSSVPFIQTSKDPCVSRPWSFPPIFFEAGKGWHDGGMMVAWVAWR